ncbi:ATP-binding protein [Nonomuraea guangzhouensis]|uniref:ATP-binding protein n=1 Tax=Nonomuraea guangzhouensis TaxID=1291555 RepID=A0ABW4GQV2_9ACTN|nr:LuxR family transcriptional regulator [Nonomuraea guangzhouensis]
MAQVASERSANRARPYLDGSSFVGRRHELAAARRGLSQARLLTLTGTGGVGKSRLALRIAELLRGAYKDGVEVIELATLEAGDLLEPMVAGALGLREAGSDPMTVLMDHLADKRMLLVLDNCEHLLDDCARFVDRLLRGAPRLRILATSRQTLGVYGEQVLPVPSLSVPDPGHPPRRVARHDSVRLFVERAASVSPGFALDTHNAACVARLARRLEGIPLAIELAAVQLRALPLEELTRELDECFEVLAAGSPATTPRHQTLRATMDWSFRLCSPAEQRLWARLSMFPGGVDLDTAEAVCSGAGIAPDEMIDLVTGLVDKSVLVGERGATGLRYRMLESIRAYGSEQLASTEERALRRRYVGHYRDLVDRHRIDAIVPDQLERYLLLQRELPNLRVGLELCLSDPALALVGLETASAMWSFWLLAGSLTEGRYWLERTLKPVRAANSARATALWVDSMLALRQGDLAKAMPRLEECRRIARRPGNEDVLPFAIRTSGVAACSTGDARRGLALLEESLALFRAAGDVDGEMFSLYYAAVYGSIEDPGRAAGFGAEALALCEAHHAQVSRGYAQLALGMAVWNLGDYQRADTLVREAAEFTGEINDRWCLTQCLEVLAWIAGARQDHEKAARLLGAAHSLWQVVDASPMRLSYHARWHERCVEQARDALGDRAFTASFRDGASLGLERVLTCEDDG